MPFARINAGNAIPLFGLFFPTKKTKQSGVARYVHTYTEEYRLLVITDHKKPTWTT
jgi:hypothetical protein